MFAAHVSLVARSVRLDPLTSRTALPSLAWLAVGRVPGPVIALAILAVALGTRLYVALGASFPTTYEADVLMAARAINNGEAIDAVYRRHGAPGDLPSGMLLAPLAPLLWAALTKAGVTLALHLLLVPVLLGSVSALLVARLAYQSGLSSARAAVAGLLFAFLPGAVLQGALIDGSAIALAVALAALTIAWDRPGSHLAAALCGIAFLASPVTGALVLARIVLDARPRPATHSAFVATTTPPTVSQATEADDDALVTEAAAAEGAPTTANGDTGSTEVPVTDEPTTEPLSGESDVDPAADGPRDTPLTQMYARLAEEYDRRPVAPDHGGGLPGDLYPRSEISAELEADPTADLSDEDARTHRSGLAAWQRMLLVFALVVSGWIAQQLVTSGGAVLGELAVRIAAVSPRALFAYPAPELGLDPGARLASVAWALAAAATSLGLLLPAAIVGLVLPGDRRPRWLLMSGALAALAAAALVPSAGDPMPSGNSLIYAFQSAHPLAVRVFPLAFVGTCILAASVRLPGRAALGVLLVLQVFVTAAFALDLSRLTSDLTGAPRESTPRELKADGLIHVARYLAQQPAGAVVTNIPVEAAYITGRRTIPLPAGADDAMMRDLACRSGARFLMLWDQWPLRISAKRPQDRLALYTMPVCQ